ncbi:apyrase-like isoform X2 [Cylas formicarius]|uniref:apyrase-like isoform X2 n=1 Tax=Cylas formicarius TaxID=197179 RepID=UPI002958CE8E|nr:apyrase-like isoform X2 [Cylas formicarius]
MFVEYLVWTLIFRLSVGAESVFELSVIHLNDFHSRFDEVSHSGGNCKNASACVGGFARIYTQIRQMKAENPDAVLLNAGDNFQGSLYYTIGKWNITQEFLNKIDWDAVVLGNHEFDDMLAGVIPYMEAMKSPIIVSNIDDSLEPSIQGLYNKSVVIERNGKKIGIIGVICTDIVEISKLEKLKLLDESASVNAEAERLVKEEGVFTVVVLSHAGYEVDKHIAANAADKIGLIVGAHTHSFLYTGEDAPGPEEPVGPYPTIITNDKGNQVLIVQASSFSRYLGNITVYYDQTGNVVDHIGSPIFLQTSIAKDPEITKALDPWKQQISAYGNEIVGSSMVELRVGCYDKECLLGNLIADSMVFAYLDHAENNSWTYASIAIINAAGMRAGLEIGEITYDDAWVAQPFSNTIDVGEIEGKYLKEIFEEGCPAEEYTDSYSDLNILQVSGLHIEYDLTKPKGSRVVYIEARCQACQIPIYEEVDPNKVYRIIVQSYLRKGGERISALTDNLRNVQIGQTDLDVFMNYMQRKSPAYEELEERIVVTKKN